MYRKQYSNGCCAFPVVLQEYESEVGNEYVIRGNSALIKCGIPSYVADMVYVDAWLDNAGQSYLHGSQGGTF